jgi:predicted dehydrogenase
MTAKFYGNDTHTPKRERMTKRPIGHKRISRRQLILAAGAGMAAPMFIPRGVLGGEGQPGANDRIGVAAIGVGFRATLLIDQLPEAGRMVALCDCDQPRAEALQKKKGQSWPVYQSHQKLLERKDIDAVIVATQEFQRVLPCIHACQAGKDVYAEKPLSLCVREGRVLVDVVRKHRRILQVGSQQRSMEMNRVACEFIRGGGLGKLREVRCVNYPGPLALPKEPFPEEKTPAGLDWDVWLNQAAWRPYNGRWRGPWQDMTGGEMTNWGAHGLDQVQWALDADGAGPVEMWPITPGFNGQVGMRYANGVEVNFVLDRGPMGGAVFIGDKGKIEINRNKFTSNPPEIAAELRKKVNETEEERKWSDNLALWQARWHLQNWLDCVRTRKLPAADVEIGHRSISVCHLANITRYVGRKLRWDPAAERFPDDQEANRWVDRVRRKGYELPAAV